MDKDFYGFDGQTYRNCRNANVDPQASMNESEDDSIEFEGFETNKNQDMDYLCPELYVIQNENVLTIK